MDDGLPLEYPSWIKDVLEGEATPVLFAHDLAEWQSLPQPA
jgi:hypothetical protein